MIDNGMKKKQRQELVGNFSYYAARLLKRVLVPI
jgi:hypothetical protein